MTISVDPWLVDPEDPRAPPQEVWDGLTQAQRDELIASMPTDFPTSEASPPEGDAHFDNKVWARDTLRRWFDRTGRSVYLACELPVYYPGERMFHPDVFAVLDVSPHRRKQWTVSEEGKGLDIAIEIHVHGRRSKDLKRNVAWYARLGITEYFVYEVLKHRIHGFRLPSPDASAYDRIVPQGGRYASEVLGLELRVQGDRLRFQYGTAFLQDSREVIDELTEMVDAITAQAEEEARRAEEEARRAEEEARRAEEEARRAEEATSLAEELQRELDALRARLGDTDDG